MIPNNFSSIVGANFELLAALNQSIVLSFVFDRSLQLCDYHVTFLM